MLPTLLAHGTQLSQEPHRYANAYVLHTQVGPLFAAVTQKISSRNRWQKDDGAAAATHELFFTLESSSRRADTARGGRKQRGSSWAASTDTRTVGRGGRAKECFAEAEEEALAIGGVERQRGHEGPRGAALCRARRRRGR